MIDQSELACLLVLNRLNLQGAKAVHSFLWEGQKPSEILSKIEEENFLNKKEYLLKIKNSFEPKREITKAQELGIRFITILDEDYPRLLREIYDPPLVLYVKGQLIPEDEAALAIVGTRHPSFYGVNQTKFFSRELARQGLTIISGFAKGVDQIAHQAALEIPYGRTIAVLGCGLDKEYPPHSKKQTDEIIKRGAVISEYALGTLPLAENFPKRNRIIAGLSLGVFVVEAHSRSGSLITARLAAEEGREVFALPGPVDQLTSRGTHHLIKEGASLADGPEDISSVVVRSSLLQLALPIYSCHREAALPADEQSIMIGRGGFETRPYDMVTRNETEVLPVSDSPLESKVLNLLSQNPLDLEEIVANFPGSSFQISPLLILLELQKKIRKDRDGRFGLANNH